MKQKKTATILLAVALAIIINGCGGSGDVDALLDDYEAIVDQTIVYMKKVKAGDMDAMSEMTELTSKYQSFAQRMEKAEGKGMSDAQRARYMRILNKYQNALQQMY